LKFDAPKKNQSLNMNPSQGTTAQSGKQGLKVFGRTYSAAEIKNLGKTLGAKAPDCSEETQEKSNASFLGSVKLKTTRRCNLNCSFCSRGLKDKRSLAQPDPLTTEDILKILDGAHTLGARKIHLTGGEFFLRKDYLQILDHASHLNLNITITTNGTLLDSAKLNSLKNFSISALQLSLDSFQDAAHDKLRGVKGSFDRTVRSLILMEEILPQVKKNINMVATKDLYQSTGQAKRVLRLIRPHSLLLIPLKGFSKELDNFLPGSEDIEAFQKNIIPEIFPLLIEKNPSYSARNLLPYIVHGKKIRINLGDDCVSPRINGIVNGEMQPAAFYDRNTCFAPWFHSYIHDNGKVSLCCHRPDKVFTGNAKTESLEKIFFNTSYAKVREDMRRKKLARCLGCEMFIKENRILNQRLGDFQNLSK
jgi:MoaA/NifB/PqqE/SkfB family radical SAM enzyme